MKSTRLVKLISYIYYNTLSRCSDDDGRNYETRNEAKKSEESNENMSFSFNIKSYNDFKCNFDNDLISTVYSKKPEFYISKNLNNFVGIFGLIFQYSLIKNNEEFRKIIENLYGCYFKKVNDISEDKSTNVCDPNNFKNYLENLDKIIKGILENKGNGLVKIKEEDGRMIIFYDNTSSAELFNFKLVEILPKNISVKDQGNKQIVESMTEFYTKFYESYLSDSLKPGFLESFNEIFRSKNQIMKKQAIKETKPDDDPFKFLLNSYSRFCQLVNNESIDECKGNPVEKKSIYFRKVQQYSDLLEKLYISGELPKYLKDLVPKARAKYAYEVSDISIELSSFFHNSTEYNINVYTLSMLLEKALKDPKIISYEESALNNKAFNCLMLRCLELAF